MKPWKILSKIPENTLSDALRHVKFIFVADTAKFWPPAASRGDQAHKLFLFLFPVSQRTPLRE